MNFATGVFLDIFRSFQMLSVFFKNLAQNTKEDQNVPEVTDDSSCNNSKNKKQVVQTGITFKTFCSLIAQVTGRRV